MKHQEIKKLLPEVFQRTDHAGSPLYGLLEIMQTMTEPAEDIMQQVSKFFNPYTSPEKFLPYLASWVDLDRFFPTLQEQSKTDPNSIHVLEAGLLRELIVAAPQLSKLRGTATGMKLFLETATGMHNFKIEENSQPGAQPFHIKITAPTEAINHQPLITRIIEQEKPAYVTYDLLFSD